MSISDDIERAKANGKLIPGRPLVPWAPCARALLMCAPADADIAAGRLDSNHRVRQSWAAMEAAIGTFIEGGYVNDDFIKQLQPAKYEHWELKKRRPKPSLRMFGRFALPDVFVGTHIERRDSLGGMWSDEFEQQKLVCESYWIHAGLGDCFTDCPDFRYEKYITFNAAKKVRIAR